MADWRKVRSNAINAAQGILAGSWAAAYQGATYQIGLLVQTAQFIEENKNDLTSDEYNFLMAQQKIALQNVLTIYESIGIAAARNAVAAVINSILKDVPTLIGIL